MMSVTLATVEPTAQQSEVVPAKAKRAEPPVSTHFEFEAKVFQVPGARFGLYGVQEEPRFFVELGGLLASMDMKTLRSEFNIKADSPDNRVLGLAIRGLKYVADIRPGDTIPTELLDGTASWSIGPQHKATAERRLQVQLLSWVSGKEIVITDATELENFLSQIENKSKLREAFEEAAVALGKERTDHDAVFAQMDLLSRELCYIEALRERFSKIRAIKEKLVRLAIQYESDSRLKQEIQRMSMLLIRAVAFYDKHFDEVDAQTSEIIGALKAIERQVKFIRRVRDDLHGITRDWSGLIDRWEAAPIKRARLMDTLLNDTYRLLASKYATSRSLLKK